MGARVSRRLAALALVLGLPATAHALNPQRTTSQYALTKWGTGNLPGTGVHAVVQTPDGYLWIGTNAGLVRFDGSRFLVYDSRNTPSYGEGGVSCLSVARNGALYFGTTAGALVQMKDGVFTRLEHRNGTSVTSVILAATDGKLWFSLLGRPVYYWDPPNAAEQKRPVSPKLDNLGIAAIAEAPDGAVWIGTHRDGLVRMSGGEATRVPITHDVVQALHFDRAGTLWIGTAHGLLRRQGETLQRLTRADGLSDDSISAILEDSDGNLWVGTTSHGLSRLSGGRWTRFTTAEGLSDDDVRSLLEDREGNLWVGTADGLNCLSDTQFLSYGRTEGLRDHSVAAVAPGAHGSVWVGTNSGMLARFANGRFEHFPLPPALGRERVLSLHESPDGTLWIGLDNGRFFRRRVDGTITDLTPPDATRAWRATVVIDDEQGPLVFATSQGYVRVQGDKVVRSPPFVSEVGYMHVMHRDHAGVLWAGGSDGLFRIAGNEVKRYGSRSGFRRNRVRDISEDPDGGLWLATAGGLVFFKDGTVKTLGVEEGLPENYLRAVLDDGLGHLWIASMGSLFRLDKEEVRRVIAGQAARVWPVVFDASDGLRTTEAMLSNNPGFRGDDGRLWFATSRGLSVIDPTRVSIKDPAPDVRIEGIAADGRTEEPAEDAALEYGPGRGQVTIEYAALSFRAVHRVRFRYRLEGFDEGWVDAGTRRSAYYSNLPPGHYRFVVTACNHDGVWNGRNVAFSFSIQPPFYRTRWFYAGCMLGVVLLAAAAFHVRMKQMRSRFAAIIGERTRIARELHDTLAQGLAGTGIQLDTALTMLPDEPDVARDYVALGRAMVRSTLAEVRRSIWVLRAQTSKGANGLGSALPDSLRQLMEHSGLESQIHVSGEPRELAAEVERNLLRIAHEAVTNAVRHSGARHIAIDLDFAGDGVHLRVRDDGRGFDPQPWLVKRRIDHFGLVGIAERVRGLGGELQVKSREGEGTEIGCRLPYDCHVDGPDSDGPEDAETGATL
jgi:signal transduction histidine kinase/ligand-binding sensor domain-containing protein